MKRIVHYIGGALSPARRDGAARFSTLPPESRPPRWTSPAPLRSMRRWRAPPGAAPAWRSASLSQRAEIVFRFRELLHRRRDEVAHLVTAEHGKVLSDAAGEVARGLENVEFACGIPHLSRAPFRSRSHTVSTSTRSVSPSGSWPASPRSTSPRWYRCGCAPTPSPAATASCSSPARRTRRHRCCSPSCGMQAGLPDGVFNVVQGDREAVERILEHPDIAAGLLRRLHAHGPSHLRDRHPQRQARAGPGRGQEPHGRAAGRRHRHGRRTPRSQPGTARPGNAAWPFRWSSPSGGIADPLVEAIAERIPKVKVGPGDDPVLGDGTAGHSPAQGTGGRLPRARQRSAGPSGRRRPGVGAAGPGFYLDPTLVDGVQPGHPRLRRRDLRSGAVGGPGGHAMTRR